MGPGIKDQIFALYVSPNQPDTIWVGTAVSGVLVSRDGGATWSKVGAGIIPDRVPVSTIAGNPERPNDI